ncbi:hypothetical protein [Oscillibacter sp.]|uniref:hypothetical protein n=1 Tax=Oscillibacter sp. TaxID=1945593 RepID=UPI002D7E9D52|nr:hypothetical protein [Oscillibacter sp.]
MELSKQRKSIIDFIRFEDASSEIWPWAVSADDLLKSEPLLEAIEKAVRFDAAGRCGTDELYWAIDRIAGVNPVLQAAPPVKAEQRSEGTDRQDKPPRRKTGPQKQGKPKSRDR